MTLLCANKVVLISQLCKVNTVETQAGIVFWPEWGIQREIYLYVAPCAGHSQSIPNEINKTLGLKPNQQPIMTAQFVFINK